LTSRNVRGDTWDVTAGSLGLTYVLGPQQMPPQGAKALVRALLRTGGGGPTVSCVLFDRHQGETELEFRNEGGETAVDLRYVVADAQDVLAGDSLGHLPPGAATAAAVHVDVSVDPFRCVWMCADSRRRLRVWSYDGRHKRVRRKRAETDEACFHLMYG
jgi:hypothetical protein